MPVTSIGDLARSYVLRTRNTDLRQSLTRLGQEVASGRTSDPVARLGGHFSYLSQIEHDLVLASGSLVAGALYTLRLEATLQFGSVDGVASMSFFVGDHGLSFQSKSPRSNS